MSSVKLTACPDRFGCSEDYGRHVEGKTILAIAADRSNPDLPDLASFWTVDFYVEGYTLSLSTDAETDEIKVTVDQNGGAPTTVADLHPIFKPWIGRELGWFWSAVNSQGYNDMMILAFASEAGEGATPQFAFLVEGSTIQIHKISAATI